MGAQKEDQQQNNDNDSEQGNYYVGDNRSGSAWSVKLVEAVVFHRVSVGK